MSHHQRLFLCPNCGSDTLHESVHHCPIYQVEAARQTSEKCKELGIGGNLELFGLPKRTGDP